MTASSSTSTVVTTTTSVVPIRSGGVVVENYAFVRTDRTLFTTVFRPAATERYPLFVWAHGFDATVEYFAPLLRAIAARGYVVAAPLFPYTSLHASGSDR